MQSWLARLYEDAAAGRLGPTHHPLFRVGMDAVHVGVVLVRETVRDRLHVRAAMLSYWTSVALVPLLVLGFALTGPFGLAEQTRTTVRHMLYDTIFANSIEEVGAALDMVLEHASLGALGVFGMLGIMLTGSQLFFNAELAYNDIFRVGVRRSWILRFTLFYAAITLGPVALASGLLLGAELEAGLGGPVHQLHRLLPGLLTSAVLVAAIRLLPCTPVPWRAALTGGLVSAVGVELAKQGFEAYTDLLGARDNLARIYGQVALLPVLLLWIYVFWLVVLFGVEVAFLVHNHGSLLDAQRRLATDPDAARRQPDGFFALAVLGLIIEQHDRGRGPVSAAELSELSGADPRHLQVVLDVLEEGALIAETADKGFLPARPATQISASEVLRLWRDKAAPAVFGPARGSLQMALAAVDHALMGNLSSHGRQGGGRA